MNTATALLGVGIATALGATYLTRPAAPLAHPFLLGRQSIIARTRNGSESPVYSSSSTGGMRAPLRPEKRLRTMEDILAESKSLFEGGVRGNWAKGGDKVTDLVEALRAGLLSTLGSGEGKVAVLVEDPTGQFHLSPRSSTPTDFHSTQMRSSSFLHYLSPLTNRSSSLPHQKSLPTLSSLSSSTPPRSPAPSHSSQSTLLTLDISLSTRTAPSLRISWQLERHWSLMEKQLLFPLQNRRIWH